MSNEITKNSKRIITCFSLCCQPFLCHHLCSEPCEDHGHLYHHPFCCHASDPEEKINHSINGCAHAKGCTASPTLEHQPKKSLWPSLCAGPFFILNTSWQDLMTCTSYKLYECFCMQVCHLQIQAQTAQWTMRVIQMKSVS